MNHSKQSIFVQMHVCALKHACRHTIGCLFWIAGLWLLLAQTTWAANGKACLPRGFNSFSPISPNVISLKKNQAADQLLSTQTVTDSFSSTACISNTDAELSYIFLENSQFVNTDSAGPFKAYVNILTNTPTQIRVGYSLRTSTPDAFGSIYSFYINYFITVQCAGGLSASALSNTELRIAGINSSACMGNYTVSYKFEIWQNGGNVFNSGYIKKTTGTGFRTRVSLYSGTTQTHTALTTIPSSETTVFQSNVSCAYSLSSSSLNLGSFTDAQIFRQNILPAAFSINTSNCINTSGGGNSHGLYVYWNFDAVDPNDPTILANTATGANASTNVGAKISCNSGSAIAQDNTAVKLDNAIATQNTYPCIAYLVPMSNAGSADDIQPGSFTSRATLTFQFD